MRSLEGLAGRVVVITGAARGIGRAYTSAFLRAGARVVATDRTWEGVEPLDAGLATHAIIAEMDVTSDDAIEEVARRTLERFESVDVLINNAALRQRELFPPTGRTTTLATTDHDWRRSFEVNVLGTLRVTRRFIRPMLEQRRGSIIMTASSGILHSLHGAAYTALRPDSREMPYQASKAALASMSFYLADEVREQNVAVNVLIPGHTRTTGFDEQNRARSALGSTPGPPPLVPEHMIPLALFLAARNDAAVTGNMFDVVRWNTKHGHGGPEQWLDASAPRPQ